VLYERITNRLCAERLTVVRPPIHRGIARVFHSSTGDRTMAMKKKAAKKAAKKKGGKKKAAKKK
jgi:hypothetical protein